MGSTQAWPTIIGAGAVILSLVAQSMLARRFQNRKHNENVARLDTIEQTVNGNFDKVTSRVEQLTVALTSSDVPVPTTPPKGEA